MDVSVRDDTHQGYGNYETFAVTVYISNSQSMQKAYHGLAMAALRQKDDRGANCILADWLKDHFTQTAPDIGSPYAELMHAGLSEVDWLEIANELLEEIGEKP